MGSTKNQKSKPLNISSSFAHSLNLPADLKSTPYLDWNANQLAKWLTHIKLGPYGLIFKMQSKTKL